MVGLYACIWVAGFVIAITAYLLTFLRWEARLNWDDALYLAAAGFLFVVGSSWIMTLYPVPQNAPCVSPDPENNS
jgi:uncharacterized membrane protein